MLLVPRQLRRAGMTGAVPYYGGRLSPAQAYAASHGGQAPPPSVPTFPVPSAPAPRREPVSAAGPETLAALQHLLDTGVLTADEYAELRARAAR